ncbi:MAG: phosphoglucosamine mutase, partial [Clostridiaceae bacterium]|nr:phosphoglucosamine mutase [Clostridiaceae bacterium]
MGKLFGTDGVRGIANIELTPELAYKLGKAGAYVLTQEKRHRPKILVGMDTRISGHMLKSSIVSGICSMGAQAVVLGVIPTPAIAYLVRHYGADAGIVISASHNSFEFNGIKIFNSSGYKLPDHLENKIEDIVLNSCKSEEFPKIEGKDIGTEIIDENAVEYYLNYAKNTIDTDLSGLKIAVDCANGAAYKIAPKVLELMGAHVFAYENKPDGININDKCGSTYINNIRKLTQNTVADIGLAFDGDADRLLACDENGNLVDGDKILAITGLQMKKEGRLKKNTIVVTVMTNIVF